MPPHEPELMVDGPQGKSDSTFGKVLNAAGLGTPELWAKFGLVGLCLFVIAGAMAYQSHQNAVALSWALERIAVEEKAAADDRAANWRAVKENTDAMREVLTELRAAKKGQDEIKAQVRSVEKAVKEMP